MLALLTCAGPAQARDQTFYSPEEFRRALEAARSNGGVLQGIMQNSKSIPYIGTAVLRLMVSPRPGVSQRLHPEAIPAA